MKKIQVCVFLSLLLFLASLLHHLLRVQTKDRQEYAAIMQMATPKDQQEEKKVHQQRYLVRKDIWLTKEHERLHLLLLCPESELRLTSSHEGFVEEMHTVRCWMQDQLLVITENGKKAVLQPDGRYHLRHTDTAVEKIDGLKERQILRYVSAQNARFYAKNHTLFLQDLFLENYEMEGHLLVPTPPSGDKLMQGKARSAQLAFAKDPTFHIDHLKATFFDSKP